MSNIIVVPKRSIGGCFTCKRRKKKCDEQRPYCRRCIQGDFDCLGYGFPEDGCVTHPSSNAEVGPLHRPPDTAFNQCAGQFSDSVSLPYPLAGTPRWGGHTIPEPQPRSGTRTLPIYGPKEPYNRSVYPRGCSFAHFVPIRSTLRKVAF
ncbi:hypothetical protein B0J17DRAFT_683565 [Rhizoctonia solani]|nr:hypothetical protein B0J17DRAFT_683565 [Rhizoctonia solani]